MGLIYNSKISDEHLNFVLPISNTRTNADRPKRKYFNQFLKDLRDSIVNTMKWVVVETNYEITNDDFSKLLWIKADCILTVDSYSSLDEGFFCGIILSDEFNVQVKTSGVDRIRQEEKFVFKDGAIIKTPIQGQFALIGKVE